MRKIIIKSPIIPFAGQDNSVPERKRENHVIKKVLATAVAVMALPVVTQAQVIDAQPGFYIGAGGGVDWLLGSSPGSTGVGWAAGGTIGYDFVGPRVSIDVGYGQVPVGINIPGTAINGKAGMLTALANLSYDFFPTSVITPYIGAGAGIAFIDSNQSLGSTQFAYDAFLGVKYNASNQLSLMLEGRYVGTTNPSVTVGGQTFTGQNNNIAVLAGVAYKFVAAAAPPPPPPPAAAAPSYMVFFDWDRSNLSAQALNTIKQAANTFKTKGNARITATGHADKSGPENYNMALSLRRANAVKDALVREGVPATAIAVIGRGESQPLVPTADGVREPQNRRVEIVIQ
jgi:OOP family OmpA-OmpF porin